MVRPFLNVVKIGGNVIDDATALSAFLESFARLEGHKILVHGGGKLATELATQLQVPQQMIAGRRVTDEATLRIVTMVYAGYINKHVVAQLQAAGSNALGLSGADGNLLQAHKRIASMHDYGFAGDVDTVNDRLLQQLLDAGFDIVVAPITHDRSGQLLNTNADTIARELAQALSSLYRTNLIYCFEKAGVLLDISDSSSCISVMDREQFQQMTDNGLIYEGMLPKLQNAFGALDRGVQRVVIGKWDQLQALVNGDAGTTIINKSNGRTL